MGSDDQISRAWTAHRSYLVDLAFRMLEDIGAAEDVVQEAFFRLVQTPLGGVADERGWLIVVTSRLCLDHIRSAPGAGNGPRTWEHAAIATVVRSQRIPPIG
jgi:RNA polymerase sigma-70 factor, ECF subfamily